jgi:Lon protease-like protein
MAATPMFPLGSVLVPSMVLPLHVFEARYRALVQRCLAEEGLEFGVVLIERGHEVGGGDVRTSVGCMARIVAHEAYPDGRYGLVTVGTDRVRVLEWLEDDPYPRAEVEHWPDPAPSDDAREQVAGAELALRHVLDLARRRGLGAPPSDMELSDDPSLFSHQATALAPVGPLDKLALLSAATVEERLERLLDQLEHARIMIEAQTAE